MYISITVSNNVRRKEIFIKNLDVVPIFQMKYAVLVSYLAQSANQKSPYSLPI